MNNETTAQKNGLRRTGQRQRRSTRFKVLVGVGSFVAIILLALVVEAGLSYNKVHPGVSVTGLDLGGLTRDEAVAELTAHVAETQTSPIKLTGATRTWDVMPADLGTEMDIAGAVSAAMEVTRESNFLVDFGRRIKLYFAGRDLPLQGTVDSAKLDSFLVEIAGELDVPAVNAGLAIEGAYIKAVEGQDGSVVDQDALRQQLQTLLLSQHATELPVPMIAKEPDVQVEDNQAALEQARTMTGSSVTLKSGESSWTITPAEIAGYMEFTSEIQNGVSTLVPLLSALKMTSFFAGIAESVATDPVDASFASDGTKAWVVPGQPGLKLDPEGTAKAITAAALKTTDRVADVALMESEPDSTTAEAEAMGIKDLLASYETEPYTGSSNRQVNVRITTKYAENVFLAPGEEYDFDERIGPRNAERGYKLAPGIVGNGVMEDVFGGGICQVSTTLFNAVFEAGLEILERHNHSLYISHYPDGRDATVAGQSKNFRFRNDTDHYIWIRGRSDGVHTRFSIYGTDDGREVKISFSGFSYGAGRTEETVINPALGPGQTHVKASGQSGRSCSVKRTVTMPDGTVLFDGPEVFKSSYPMIPRLVEVGPTTTTTTLRSTTTTTSPTTGTTDPATSTTVTIGF